jgi:hypothetical protein
MKEHSDAEKIDPNHPYGGLEVLSTDSDSLSANTWKDRFNTEFVDGDTGLLNIGKYDHERLMEFINQELTRGKSVS